MTDHRAANNKRTLLRLSGVAVVMFAFGVFAMPPLYDRFCELTGLGQAGVRIGDASDAVAASDRSVRIRFDATTHSELSWDFEPAQSTMDVPLGTPSEALYLALNPEDEAIVGRAVYNVTPPEAGLYFVKTECFCFTEQLLNAHETREMPVYFYVKPDLPDHIDEITLSYTFFRNETDQGLAQAEANNQ